MSETLHRSVWDSPPSRLQKRVFWLVVAALLAIFVAAIPFATIPLSGTAPLVPAYAAAMFVIDAVTATLLVALFIANATVGILVLALGYLFSGLIAAAWAATFPGVFDGAAWFEVGDQATAYIAALRRLGFPAFVIAYVASRHVVLKQAPHHVLWLSVGATVSGLAVLLAALIIGQDHLPALMADSLNTTPMWNYVVGAGTVMHVMALAVLLKARRSALDMWLILVVATMFLEFIMLAQLSSGRFSLGWWAGRCFGLASASFVLIVLTVETALLHTRLTRSEDMQRRAREARLATMEALSASIAHEVNQPLSSMVTNADASIRWLQRSPPDVDRARLVLCAIIADGHRAGAIIEGIRTIFRKNPQKRVRQDLNALILTALRDREREAGSFDADVAFSAASDLPAVDVNEVQMRQVIDNLVANALEALERWPGRKEVRISSQRTAGEDVLVTVSDTGPGLPPDGIEKMFEPFATTKPQGLGLGLMICRSIVEAHGGRLWAEANPAGGAVFHFRLPGTASPAAMEECTA
jgi:signal transduction histidine kinase